MIYATRGLVETVLSVAADAAPESVTMGLSVTPAGELTGTDLRPETPVFTDFYMPDAGGSLRAVFGVDLATPAGQTNGRFVSHPDGLTTVRRSDDLHEVVFVGVPPWDRADLHAYDRRGRPRELSVLDLSIHPGSPP